MNRRNFILCASAAAPALLATSVVGAAPVRAKTKRDRRTHGDVLRLGNRKTLPDSPNKLTLGDGARAKLPVNRAPKSVSLSPFAMSEGGVFGVALGVAVLDGGASECKMAPKGAFSVFYPTTGLKRHVAIELVGRFPPGMQLKVVFIEIKEGKALRGYEHGVHSFGRKGRRLMLTLDARKIPEHHQLRLDLSNAKGDGWSLREFRIKR